MKGGGGRLDATGNAGGPERAGPSIFQRAQHRSTLEAVAGGIPAARAFTGLQQPQQPFHEVGHVTSERVARLCGDHQEHCYEAQRLTTHGTTCISVSYHTSSSNSAATSYADCSSSTSCSNNTAATAGEQHLLVCATSTNNIAVFNAAASSCVAQHTKGAKRLSSAFTPSLSHVAVFGDPVAPAIELQLCNLNRFAFLDGHAVEVRCVEFTPDGWTFISGGRGGLVCVWQVRLGPQPQQQQTQQQQPQQQEEGGSVASTPPRAAVPQIQVIRHALQGHAAATQVKCCCISADGRWAATGGSDGRVLLWDLSAVVACAADADAFTATLAAATAAAGPPPRTTSSSTSNSSTNNCCIVPGPPGLAQLAAEWQLGQLGREQITCLSLAADGSVLAVGTRTGRVHLVLACSSSQGRQLVQLPPRHTDGYKVRGAALSPDASKLVTTADDARMVLWDVASRGCMLSIHEHTKPVRGCCWSPNGKHICSVGDDNLLIVLDVVLLGRASSSSGGSSRLRLATRLDGLAAGTAAAAAAEAEAAGEGGGSGSQDSSGVLRHSCLRRMEVSMTKERLLACVPLPPAPPSRCSYADSSLTVSPSKLQAAEAAAAVQGGAGMQDGVLCADQSGQLLLLPPDSTAAVPTGMSIGSSIACCCFDGGVVAAAKRDGAVTVMSCSPGSGVTAATTPAKGSISAAAPPASAAASGVPAAGGAGLATAPTAAAPATPAAAAAAASVAPDQQIAVSAKLDMLVVGLSVSRVLGRVAVTGVERKSTTTGVVQLWEFDPSVRPAALKAQATLRGGLSTMEPLTRQHSNRSMLSSKESADDDDSTPGSPTWVSIDFGDGQQGKGAAAAAGASLGSPLAAAGKRRSSGGGVQARLSSNADASSTETATVAAGAAGAGQPGWGCPQGWLWHCSNPVKVLSCQEGPLLCSAWTKGPGLPKLVVGSSAGWVVVVDCEGEEMEDSLSRYQIHKCEVSAVDCAADGATIATGGSDGRIVLWSHVTGFKLAVFTVHSNAIRSLAFNHDATLLAAGDTDGIVSSWDVAQSCLLAAAQVHDGCVSSCCWSSTSSLAGGGVSGGVTGSSGRELSVISCGYDATLSAVQVDASIYRQYCAAFCGLYYSCKKTNKLHKLEATLNWHLQHGALQDASVLQLLVVQAAADGNAAMLSLILPLFDRMDWLLHFGPIFSFARPSLAGPPSAALRKTDSNNSLAGGHGAASSSRHDQRRRKQSAEYAASQHHQHHPQPGHTAALQAYQATSSLAPSAAAAAAATHIAAGSGMGLGLEDYVIHPHDRTKITSSSTAAGVGGRGGRGTQTPPRRSTADRLLGGGHHKRSGSYGDGSGSSHHDSRAQHNVFLEGSVVSTPRNSRWAHSVADIKTILAFNPSAASAAAQAPHQAAAGPSSRQQQAQQQARQQQQSRQLLLQQLQQGGGSGRAAAGAALLASSSAGDRSSFNSTASGLQAADGAAAAFSDPGSLTFGSLHRSGSGGVDSDASGSVCYSPSVGADSPRSASSPAVTPTRMLSPSVSRNARAAAQLPLLDTLHEESHSRNHSTDERGASGAGGGGSSGGGAAGSSFRRMLPSLAAAAAALSATRSSTPDGAATAPNSPRHASLGLLLSPRFGAAAAGDDSTAAAEARDSRGSDSSVTLTPYTASPSPNAFLNHILRSARCSQQQQQHGDGSPGGSEAAAAAAAFAAALPPHGSPLQRQGSGSGGGSGGLNPPQQPQQQQHEEPHRQVSQRESLARQVAGLVSNRWLTRRWTSQDRGEAHEGSSSSSGGGAGAGDSQQQSHSAPLPLLSSGLAAAESGAATQGTCSSTPDAAATITAAAAAAEAYAFAAAVSSAEQASHQQNSHGSGSDSSSSSRDPAPAKQTSARAFILRLASSISRVSSSRGATAESAPDPAAIRAAASGLDDGSSAGPDRAHQRHQITSAFSAASGVDSARFNGLGASKRKLLASWASWRESSRVDSRACQQHVLALQQQQQLLQRPPTVRRRLTGAAVQRADLLQVAMASQQAQCVRLVVDALLEGRFSKVSVVLHMYEALQALIHDPQHKRTCRRLLKHLSMIENGEVQVDSLLVHTKIIYKCSAHGHTGKLWSDAISSHQALLDALDVLVKHSSWRDSIVALLMWPVLWSLRHLGASWLWLWARQGLRLRHRVLVSARSQLVPVAHAAEIRPSSRGNLLRQLLSANVDADLYGKELVRAVINVKWESFARAFLLMQFVQFLAFLVLFLAYMAVAVYANDPAWTTSELVAHPQGRAAVALECILMVMMFGQAADEAKQMVTYKQDYFNSPWNYFDCASIVIIAALFLLHISRLNHQLFIILVALELLLLCLRALYFCMAAEKVGALLRMVLIVIKDMRYFFLMLVFLLVCFGLTFSVLMSPVSSERLNLVSLVGSVSGVTPGTKGTGSEAVQVFGSLEDSVLQLFTIMFGDLQFSTLKTILSVNTAASKLAVFMAAIYAVLVLIVLVNLLIAIVDETYGVVKESEADQILRNKALIIDEIESTLTDSVIQDLNSRVLLPYVHILIPQAARTDQQHRRRDLHGKMRKLKHFIRQSLQEQAASSAAAVAAATAAAAAAAAAVQKWPGPLAAHSSQLQPGGSSGSDPGSSGVVPVPVGYAWPQQGQQAAVAGGQQPSAAAAVAAEQQQASLADHSGRATAEGPSRPHNQLRPNSLSGPVGWASLRRHSGTSVGSQHASMTDQQQQVTLLQLQDSSGQAAEALAAGAAAAAAEFAAAVGQSEQPGAAVVTTAGHNLLQQDLQQLSCTVGSLNQQVETVAATSAAAVAGLSTKLDSLQSDVGQMKQLLLALLERQQQ